MALTSTQAARVRGIVTTVPPRRFDNLRDATEFGPDEVRRVVQMTGVRTRHLADERITTVASESSSPMMISQEWSG